MEIKLKKENKVINIIKDKKDIIIDVLFLIVMALMISTSILNLTLIDLDEMWNYNFSKNIFEGLLPYKDFNIIQMPLTAYIGAIFLAIFGNQLISMRIFAIISNFLIIFISYKLLKKIEISRSFAKLIILGIVLALYDYFRIDYNFLILLLSLIISYIEVANREYINKINHKSDILLGILAGLCICTKQTTGICISIVTIFYQIMFVNDKATFRIFIRKMLDRIIGCAIPLILLMLYFTIFGLWNNFVDYCILGIKTFNNKVLYTKLLENKKWYIKGLSIIVPVYLVVNLLIILINKLIRKKEINFENTTLLAYSWASIVVVYPISNAIHFLIGAFISILNIAFIIYTIWKKYIKNKFVIIYVQTLIQVFVLLICIRLFYNNLDSLINYYKSTDEYKQINHFYYIPKSSYSRVKAVDEYIKKQDKKVYILDAQAALYTIPIDQYNKNFDMFLKGNIGSKAEDGMIDEINNMENIQILILKDSYKLNWQTPVKVINYVKNNLNKIGDVGVFDIYEK